MASYEELYALRIKGGLSNRVLVAILDVANDVANEDSQVPNHARRYDWAAQALRDPSSKVLGVLSGVLIANKSASVDAILNASDEAIKDAVADLVDLFAGVESV